MQMKAQSQVMLLLIMLSALGIGCAVSNQQSAGNSNVIPQSSPSSTAESTLDPNEVATISFERTAIAVFTQNPTVALSSTPFYAEIIFNEVVRNLTEIPFPRRSCYLVATKAPEDSTRSNFECGPLLATIALSDDAYALMDMMKAAGIEGTAGGDSNGLEGINESDNRSFVAVQSHLGFLITIETVSDQTGLSNLILKLTDALNQNWHILKYVSSNAELYIQFTASDGSQYISTTYEILKQVYRDGLTGKAVIQAVGGLKETPPQIP